MKHNKKIMAIVLMAVIAVMMFIMTACDGGSSTFTVTYNVGTHGQSMESETFSKDEPIEFADPERKDADTSKGYEFAGWYTNADFLGSAVYGSEDISPAADVTVYADWKIANYGISYTLNGGTAASGAPATYTYFEETTLIPATKPNFRFGGWFANQQLTGDAVSSISKGQEGSKRFWAKWNPLAEGEYGISYDLDGGKWTITDYPQSYQAGTELVLPAPDRTGYAFLGWYTEKTGGDKVDKITATDSGVKKFYARWNLENYTLTYNVDGGTLPSGYKQTYTYQDTDFFLPTATKSGSDFGGWYEKADFSGAITSFIKGNSTGSRTLYARWLSVSTNPATTTKYEAENVDLSLFNGAGYSGGQSGVGAIVEDANASGGKYVGWLNDANLYIDYVINSDRAVSGATITLSVNFEQIKGIYALEDITLTPAAFSVIVSDVECQYASTVIKAGDDPNNMFYTTVTVPSVKLVAGANIIRLRTNVNTYWGGERTAGPGIDYITINTNATLTWTPIPN